MVLDICRELLDEIEQGSDDEHEVEEKVHKLKQLKTVLEMYGTFSGINRKVQFKLVTKRQGEPCKMVGEGGRRGKGREEEGRTGWWDGGRRERGNERERRGVGRRERERGMGK